MAKTYDDGAWPRNFEAEIDDEDFEEDDVEKPSANAESYHTLRRRGSDGKHGSDGAILDIVPQNSLEIVASHGLKKGDLPE